MPEPPSQNAPYPEPKPHDERLNQVIGGRYRIEHAIAHGGMGSVYRAKEEIRERGGRIVEFRPVVVKFIRRDDHGAGAAHAALQRFENEVKAVIQLKSPHVVDVITFALDQDDPYIVMEHLDGEDFRALIEKGEQLAVERAVYLVFQACLALAEVHEKDIVHRDIKPENLFITTQLDGDFVTVLDFGIAQLREPGVSPLTDSETRLGTPHYMPPEQLMDSAGVDARSDVWALGAVLYELLTLEKPFPAPSRTELHKQILTGDAKSITELRPGVPDDLVSLIHSALQKDRDRRPPNAAAMVAALAPFTGPRQGSTPLVRPLRAEAAPAPVMVVPAESPPTVASLPTPLPAPKRELTPGGVTNGRPTHAGARSSPR